MSYSRGRTPPTSKKTPKHNRNFFQRLGYKSASEFCEANTKELFEKSESNKIEFNKDSIEGEYDESLNIRKVHNNIVKKLEIVDKTEIQKIQRKKDKLIASLENDDLTLRDIHLIDHKIKECEQKINEIENNLILKNYRKTVSNILSAFDQQIQSDNPSESAQISTIVDKYVQVTSSLFENVSLSKKRKKMKDVCNICQTDMSAVLVEDGYRTCPCCGKIKKNVMNFYQNDSKFDEKKPESTENVKNFRKAILNFDMRADVSNLPRDSEIIEKLDKYFELYNPICHRDRVANNGFDRWIRKGTSVEDMETAMKDVKYNEYYDNIYYLCKIYWGWKRPGISHLEETLVEDFRNSRQSYNTHKGTRNSSMNVNYELYHGLRRHGFDCKFSDFKMIKTKETLDEYDEIRKKVEADMGWN